MAVNIKHEDGSRTQLFPSHDSDAQDEGLALELAEYQAREALIAAARQVSGMLTNYSPHSEWAWEAEKQLRDALDAYDAAGKASRDHDSYATEEAQ